MAAAPGVPPDSTPEADPAGPARPGPAEPQPGGPPPAGPPRREAAARAPSAYRYGRPSGRRYEAEPGHSGSNAGWSLFSYLLSGMAVYGGLGWLIGHWTGLAFLFPAGLFFGLGAAILLIVLRYGRS